jgi:hypothetical protein
MTGSSLIDKSRDKENEGATLILIGQYMKHWHAMTGSSLIVPFYW